jgi:hypothetical protein
MKLIQAYVYKKIFIQFSWSSMQNIILHLDVKIWHICIHITHRLKVVNDTSLESTELLPDSPQLNLSDYHVWNEPFKSLDLVRQELKHTVSLRQREKMTWRCNPKKKPLVLLKTILKRVMIELWINCIWMESMFLYNGSSKLNESFYICN